MTVTELVNVGMMEGNGDTNTENHYQNTDFNTESNAAETQNHKQIKQMLMADLLKILTSISINRTPELAKKIKQYRVLEFFAREI